MRRIAAVAAAAVALAFSRSSRDAAIPSSRSVTARARRKSRSLAIQQKLTAQGKLRNGKMVHLKSGPYFVSAEIHLDSDAPHDKGDIATWATDDIKSTDEFQSVDVHAREESTWPHASLDVTADGAIESRACVGLNTGKTKAQIQCEQDGRAPARAWGSRRARTAATYERHD